MRFATLKDPLAIYAARMEACLVGAVRVLPRPGDYSCIWMNPNLTGKIKGGQGTRHR